MARLSSGKTDKVKSIAIVNHGGTLVKEVRRQSGMRVEPYNPLPGLKPVPSIWTARQS